MKNILLSRFEGDLDIVEIERRVKVCPEPLNVSSLDSHQAAEVLKIRLEEIYIPNQFSLALIREVFSRARLYCNTKYSTELDYVRGIYTSSDVEVNPICLTGLAGVGKSKTISALRKILPPPTDLDIDHFAESIEIVSHWYASGRGKSGGRQILLDFLGEKGGRPQVNVSALLSSCRRRASRDGVALVLLEEMQHINTGQGSARVTDILLTMAAIGPPMVFISNYSLVHKLFTRNSEDKQRLLSDPRIMLPDEVDSIDWFNYINELIRVGDGILPFEADELAHELYKSTFGIKRLAVFLIKIAYLKARSEGRGFIRVGDLLGAYGSSEYSTSKTEVEILLRQVIQNQRIKADLWCPFALPKERKANLLNFTKDLRDKKVEHEAFLSSLRVSELAVVQDIQSEGRSEALSRGATRKRPAPIKSTKQSLVDAYNDLVKGSKTPRPKN